MNEIIRKNLTNIYSDDRDFQLDAFVYLLGITEKHVDWAYEVWDEMLASFSHKNNRVRAIAAQILINLVKSDPDQRFMADFKALLAVNKDERFVTARHCLQSIWKVGLVGKDQQQLLVSGLEHRFHECAEEKNCTLIRYDIIQGMRNLYDEVGDEQIRSKALELIATEDDLKYHKKYAGLWKST